MASGMEAASDTEDLDLGASVADSSADDREVLVDELGTTRDTKLTQRIGLPHEELLECLACTSQGRRMQFFELNDLVKHISDNHPLLAIEWFC